MEPLSLSCIPFGIKVDFKWLQPGSLSLLSQDLQEIIINSRSINTIDGNIVTFQMELPFSLPWHNPLLLPQVWMGHQCEAASIRSSTKQALCCRYPSSLTLEGPDTFPLLACGSRTLQIDFLAKPSILHFLIVSKMGKRIPEPVCSIYFENFSRVACVHLVSDIFHPWTIW